MKITRTIGLGIFCTLLSLAVHAQQFSFDATEPNFRITIPNIPAMTMGPHPLREGRPHLRFMGTQGPYNVSVMTPTADAGMSPLDCANSIFRSLESRPGVPRTDDWIRDRLDHNTYLVIYVTPVPRAVQLHGYLLSAAGGTHCVEVHASKISTSKDDVPVWIEGLRKARIEPRI